MRLAVVCFTAIRIDECADLSVNRVYLENATRPDRHVDCDRPHRQHRRADGGTAFLRHSHPPFPNFGERCRRLSTAPPSSSDWCHPSRLTESTRRPTDDWSDSAATHRLTNRLKAARRIDTDRPRDADPEPAATTWDIAVGHIRHVTLVLPPADVATRSAASSVDSH